MTEKSNPKKLILDSYDSLINRVDIHAEEVLTSYDDNGPVLVNTEQNISTKDGQTQPKLKKQTPRKFDLLEEDDYVNPFKEEYEIDNRFKSSLVDPKTTTIQQYVNKMRQDVIDELKKLQEDTLKLYDKNKTKINEEKDVDVVERSLFGNKYCLILESNLKEDKSKSIRSLFGVYLFVFDFYIDFKIQYFLK